MYMIVQKCSLWNVAQVFFAEPTKTHHIKEISRRISLAHTSVKKHVIELVREGLIEEDMGVFSRDTEQLGKIPSLYLRRK